MKANTIIETQKTPGAALVTGAARRIGRSIAIDLARQGWQVAIHFGSSQKEANAVVKEIKAEGLMATALEANLADSDNCRELIKEANNQFGTIRCLVNNASVFERDEIDTLTKNSWDRHFDINLRASALLTREFAEQLPQDNEGNIINIIDQRVWNLTPHFVSYSVSKAALWSFTQISAQALAPRIRVNGIGPGPVLPSTRQTTEDFARQVSATPLGRGATPAEICDAIRYILRASGMTGQMIALDGGAHLSWRLQESVE